MRPKTLNQTIIKLISERCFEHLFVGLPPWWASIICDSYTVFVQFWGLQSMCLHSGEAYKHMMK